MHTYRNTYIHKHTYICTYLLTLNTNTYINAAYLFNSCGGRAVHPAVYVGESAGRFDRLSRPMDIAFSPERVRYMYVVMNIILSYIHTYITYMIFLFLLQFRISCGSTFQTVRTAPGGSSQRQVCAFVCQ